MNSPKTLDSLVEAQATWAARRWPGHVGRRAPSLDDNLICPLSVEVRREFEAGSGGEVGRDGKAGKMSSLRSSSALSYYVFAPWRGRELQTLAAALQTTLISRSLRFEQKYRHGLRTTPPNIDVVLDDEVPQPVGVECKFTEPYGKKASHRPLDPKYFAGRRSRWAELDLPACQALAVSIGSTTSFRRLAAGQLLKHLLGLARTTRNVPRLRYVWFDAQCTEALEHRAEVERFAEQIDPLIDFAAITYQDLIVGLSSGPEPIPGYHAYLKDRYFGASIGPTR